MSSAREQLAKGRVKTKPGRKDDLNKPIKVSGNLRKFIDKVFRIAWPGIPEIQIHEDLLMNDDEIEGLGENYGCHR